MKQITIDEFTVNVEKYLLDEFDEASGECVGSLLPDGYKIPNKKDFELILQVFDVKSGEYLVSENLREDDYSKEMKEAIQSINNNYNLVAEVYNGKVSKYARRSIDLGVHVIGFKVEESLTDGE